MSYWRDENFQEKLLTAVCRDRQFMRKVGQLLSPEDFKPRKGDGSQEVYWIAQRAFAYWKDYREPISGFLRTEMLDYIREHKRKIGTRSRDKILDIVEIIRKAEDLVAPEAIEKKVLDYKKREARKRAIKDLIDLQEQGELNDDKYLRVLRGALNYHDHTFRVGVYEDEVEKRIRRREKAQDREYPYLMIEPFDTLVRSFPRGQYGILLAKYKTGKSTGAVFLAQAYALQGYNVILVTLEDDQETVEDRLDASFTGIKVKYLHRRPNKLRRRMRRALDKLSGKIRVIDGVESEMTISRIEEIWDNYRNSGWTADIVIVDSDEHVTAPEHYKGDSGERREMKDIHLEFKRFVARHDLWGWMTSQATRGKPGKRRMIITGDDSAIDISKMKRCALCIGVGDGPEEWGDDGRYLYIAAHRFDRGFKGFPIMGDFERSIFYDKEKTEEAMQSYNKHKDKD